MIDRATVDRIVAAADIVEVVGDFISLKKRGSNYTACCPFHNEKTPSFSVNPARGLYKCFGCGKGGGVVSFVMEHEKLTYPEALKWLARKYGIEVEEVKLTDAQIERNNDKESMLVLNSWADSYFASQLHSTPQGRSIGLSYFVERGFTLSTIKTFSLGYCPEGEGRDAMSRAALAEGYQEKFLEATGLTILRESGSRYYDRFCGRVMFPIHSLTGRVIGFGGRTMSSDKKTAKYLNSPQSEIYDKSQTLYGIFQAKKSIVNKDKCILVEGYTDVMQMHQSGVENVVASSGTSLTEMQVKLIKRFTKNVTVIYDGDSAGIKASLRGIDMLLKDGLTVRVVPLPEGEDPDSFAKSRSASELTTYIDGHEEDFLQFKTRILLDDAKGDPAQRAALIGEIVASIAVIPDNITREVYIKECARAMDISYDVLSREVVQKIISAPNPHSLSMRRHIEPSTEQTPPQEAQSVAPQAAKSTAMEALERELIGYLLKYGGESFEYELSEDNIVQMPVVETIISELVNDGVVLSNPIYATIFSAYRSAVEEGRELSSTILLDSGDIEMSSKVADILSHDEVHTASQIWTRFEMRPQSERELLWKSVPKAILLYKSKVIEVRVKELQAELSSSNEEFDGQIVEQIKELNTLRMAILERCKRLM